MSTNNVITGRAPQEILDSCMQKYITKGTNITPEVFEEHITGYTSERAMVRIVGKPAGRLTTLYSFFQKTEESIDLQVANLPWFILPVPKRYKFSSDATVQLKGEQLDLGLSQKANQEYQELLVEGKVSVPKALETFGSIVNSSLRYDFAIMKSYCKGEEFEKFWEELEAQYQPTGDESKVGHCVVAGKMIRNLIDHHCGTQLRYTKVSTGRYTTFKGEEHLLVHDVTYVFNTQGCGIVNSKSPTLQDNLIPEEALHKYGDPVDKIGYLGSHPAQLF